MTSFSNDPQISLIRKLFSQAEGAARVGNMAEADTYNEKASALIAKWGVDHALLAASGEVKDQIVTKKLELVFNYAFDRRVLLNCIVTAIGAKVVFCKKHRPGTAQSYTYVGHVFAYESDLERIEFLFELLQPQMLVGAAAAEQPWYENARSFRKSWMSGFAGAILDRLKRKQDEAVVEAGTGTDLVLFDRNKAVEAEYVRVYPKTVSTARSLQGSGRSQGYAAGKRANLGNNIGGSRRAIAG